jgi:hypothetical protein
VTIPASSPDHWQTQSQRRNTIEPVIGYEKQDHGLGRNHLKGQESDCFNAPLSGCGSTCESSCELYSYALRNWLNRFLWKAFKHPDTLRQCHLKWQICYYHNRVRSNSFNDWEMSLYYTGILQSRLADPAAPASLALHLILKKMRFVLNHSIVLYSILCLG